MRETVFCYQVAEDGSLGEKTPFARCQRGLPDGLAVSADGAVWVALARGGQGVAVFEPDGSLREIIDIPLPMCTSVCFGGSDYRDLYIVSGSDDTESDRAGAVYVIRTAVPGLELAPARIPLPGA